MNPSPGINPMPETRARYRVFSDAGVCLRIDERALQALVTLARQDVAAIPRQSVEVGGILIGNRHEARAIITIDSLVPVPIEYAFGPSYRISDNDKQAFKAAAAGIRKTQRGAIIGHYRSHTSDAAEVTPDDLFIKDLLQTDLDPVMLLIEASPLGKALGRLFLGDKSDAWASALKFPLREETIAEAHALIGEVLADSRGAFGAIEGAYPAVAPTVPSRRRLTFSFSSREIIVLACLALVLLVQLAVWPLRDEIVGWFWEPPRNIRLSIEKEVTGVRIGWDRRSKAVLEASGGILEIQDAEERHRLELTREQVLSGTVFYGRPVSDLSVRLEVRGKRGNTYETIRYVGLPQSHPQPAPVVPPDAPPALPPPIPRLAQRPTEPEVAERIEPTRVTAGRPFVNPPASPRPEARIEELPPALEPAVQPSSSILAATNTIAKIDLPTSPPAPVSPTPAPVSPPSSALISYTPPLPLRRVSPAPAANVRQLLLQDVLIEVKVIVDEEGNVSNAVPVNADSGLRRLLAEQAVLAVRQWKFQPGEVNGRKVPSETTLKFQFSRTSR